MWDFMDLNTTMWQVKGEDAPLIQVESMVEPRANLSVDDRFGAEEGKYTIGRVPMFHQSRRDSRKHQSTRCAGEGWR